MNKSELIAAIAAKTGSTEEYKDSLQKWICVTSEASSPAAVNTP